MVKIPEEVLRLIEQNHAALSERDQAAPLFDHSTRNRLCLGILESTFPIPQRLDQRPSIRRPWP